jgi:hypothetical protein
LGEILNLVRSGAKVDNGNPKLRHVLLVNEVLVHGNEYLSATLKVVAPVVGAHNSSLPKLIAC